MFGIIKTNIIEGDNMEKGYQAAIEALGEIILQQKDSLFLKEYELNCKQKEVEELKQQLEEFKRKVENVEKYVEYYSK